MPEGLSRFCDPVQVIISGKKLIFICSDKETTRITQTKITFFV